MHFLLEVCSTVLISIASHRNVGHSLPLRYQKFNTGWVLEVCSQNLVCCHDSEKSGKG